MQRRNRDELWRLYPLSIEHYKYQHSDIWRSMQFYITINLAIIGLAVGLIRVSAGRAEIGSCSVVTPINLILLLGIFVSALAFYTHYKLREYFLRTTLNKCVIESLLGLMKPISTKDFKGHRLAFFPAYTIDDINNMRKDPEKWVKSNIFRKGVGFMFFVLYAVFILVDVVGIVGTSLGWF